MECALCKDKIDPEDYNTVYTLNPLTLRSAWMCFYCVQVAEESIQEENPEKYERYMEKLLGSAD